VTPLTAVAARTGVWRETARKWRVRFMEGQMDSLADAPRPGAPRKITFEQVEVVVTLVLTGTAGYRWLLMARASAAWVLSSTSRTPFSVMRA
jgi:transposase